MAPKKRGSSKKSAKVKTPTLINGLTKEELTKEQMVEHIMLLRDELDREREERNYFQLERDQVQNIWEVTRRKLENHKAELKNLEKEIEDNEQRHQVEIKVYKQKVKHLHCEHQNTMSELKADAQRSLEEKQNQQQKLEMELLEKMAAIKINKPELDIENLVNQLTKKHNEDMNETRKKSEKQLEETSLSYKSKLEDLRQELSIKRMTQTSERQDHWNSLTDAVVAEHMTIFDTAVAQLNDTVQSSLDEKDSLKKQLESENSKVKEMTRELRVVLQDTDRVSQSLATAAKETTRVERKIKYPIKAKNPNEKLRERQLAEDKRDLEELQQKFDKVQQERDQLYQTFSKHVEKVQQRADMKSLELEKQLRSVMDRLEVTPGHLCLV